MRLITQAKLAKKRVLVRGDLDVPLEQERVVNDLRLRGMLPTLEYLLQANTQVTLIGHLGNPQGKVVPALSVRPVATKLMQFLHFPSNFKILENLRFDAREEHNDAGFAKELARDQDIYVNEAFAESHRDFATSIMQLPKLLPAYAGFRLQQELKTLTQIREQPARPFVFIIGGGKTSTRVPYVRKLAELADTILLGGKLMFEQSLEGVPGVRFPVDANRIDDIGERSVQLFAKYILTARTIVWNGPLGRYEEEEFMRGTQAVAELVIQSAAQKIVGGGDTIAALQKLRLLDQMDFVSVGGGAMLKLLAEGQLPGITALT